MHNLFMNRRNKLKYRVKRLAMHLYGLHGGDVPLAAKTNAVSGPRVIVNHFPEGDGKV